MNGHLNRVLILSVLAGILGTGASVGGAVIAGLPFGTDCCVFPFHPADEEPVEESESITVIVKGMMKSRSGAT